MKHLIVFLLALTVYSCEKTTQETVVGVYTRNARKNDLTTLELQSNNRFVFKDKSEEGEVIEYGKWRLVGSQLFLKKDQELIPNEPIHIRFVSAWIVRNSELIEPSFRSNKNEDIYRKN